MELSECHFSVFKKLFLLAELPVSLLAEPDFELCNAVRTYVCFF